jgi:hypothetical protein
MLGPKWAHTWIAKAPTAEEINRLYTAIPIINSCRQTRLARTTGAFLRPIIRYTVSVAFHFIWHTSLLIIWRPGSETEVETGGAGTFSAEI